MIPIRIDKRLNRTPIVNYLLVLANVVVFIFLQRTNGSSPAAVPYLLHPDVPQVYQFFTCMFLHGGWMHLIGNMIFLWVFGNAVNDGLGHVGYLAFYLAGGVFAGVGYILLGGNAPVLGASGAISAVTGAFLVLFPRVRVTVLVILFYFMTPFEISSLVFLLLQFVWNMYASLSGTGGQVAYAAHSTGYVFGIAVAALLLAVRLVPRDVYDLLSLVGAWRKRMTYRRAVAGGYDPFGRASAMSKPDAGGRWIQTRTVANPVAEAAQTPREVALRDQISASHARGDFAEAAAGYLNLINSTENALLPMDQQLDVANYLMSAEQYPPAADAYERFLSHYREYPYRADIQLMLGLIYCRYLRKDELAQKYLSQAMGKLTDQGKLDLARKELEAVNQRLGK